MDRNENQMSSVDQSTCRKPPAASAGWRNRTLVKFLQANAGKAVFGDALRIVDEHSYSFLTENIALGFPKVPTDINLFGFDWLGRVFAASFADDEIFLIEPATADVLSLDCSFQEFLDVVLVNEADDVLLLPFLYEWCSKNETEPPAFRKCTGYQKPLFLGGVDDVTNLEEIDLDVYWTITANLIKELFGN